MLGQWGREKGDPKGRKSFTSKLPGRSTIVTLRSSGVWAIVAQASSAYSCPTLQPSWRRSTVDRGASTIFLSYCGLLYLIQAIQSGRLNGNGHQYRFGHRGDQSRTLRIGTPGRPRRA